MKGTQCFRWEQLVTVWACSDCVSIAGDCVSTWACSVSAFRVRRVFEELPWAGDVDIPCVDSRVVGWIWFQHLEKMKTRDFVGNRVL